MRRASAAPSASLLHLLLFPVLCSVMVGCYVDAPPTAPDVISARLSELLADPYPEVRRTAAEALGKIGQRSAADSGLLSSLNDQDASVRAAAALALGRLGDPDSGAALVGHLSDAAETVRAASALALGELQLSAAQITEVLQLLGQPKSPYRVAVTQALLGLDTVSFSLDLVNALRDSDPMVRQAVAAVLGETGDAKAVPYLLAVLRTDEDAGVRSEAAFRLGKVGDDRVLADLSRVVAADPDRMVRGWARWAVEQITPSRGFGSER